MAKLISWMFKAKAKSKGAVVEEETRDIPWLCHGHGPCLMVCHKKTIKDPNPLLTLYDVTQQIHRSRISQEVANKNMVASHGDWILLRNNNDASDLCLLNAVTMEKLQLPSIPLHSAGRLLLSGSPTDAANCTIFVIVMNTIFHCKIGANQFTMQDLGSYPPHAITIFQGMMYYVDDACYLNCAKLQDSSPLQFEEYIEWYELDDRLMFDGNNYLIGSHDQLLFIRTRTLEIGMLDFETFGADLSRKEWKKVNNIGGDRAIFIDDYGGFSAPVPPGGWLKGNCIYYVSQQNWDDQDVNNTTFYRYDLENGFITMLPPFPFKMPKEQPSALLWLD